MRGERLEARFDSGAKKLGRYSGQGRTRNHSDPGAHAAIIPRLRTMVNAMDLTETLEECAFRAWPAEEVEETGALRLRATHGMTRRANSAWFGPPREGDSLERQVERVEQFYRARALPSLVQLTPLAAPGLDALLEA